MIETHLLKRPPLDPHVGLYKWLAFDPNMFMPPWYQPIIVQFKPTNKLPYWKLQYPTYVKDTNHDAQHQSFEEGN
jgi:hypothetical protein